MNQSKTERQKIELKTDRWRSEGVREKKSEQRGRRAEQQLTSNCGHTEKKKTRTQQHVQKPAK